MVFLYSLYFSAISQEIVKFYSIEKIKQEEFKKIFSKNYKDGFIELNLENDYFYPTFWEYNECWKKIIINDNFSLVIGNHEGDLVTSIFFMNYTKKYSIVLSSFLTDNIQVISDKNLLIIKLTKNDYSQTRFFFFDIDHFDFYSEHSFTINNSFYSYKDTTLQIINNSFCIINNELTLEIEINTIKGMLKYVEKEYIFFNLKRLQMPELHKEFFDLESIFYSLFE